MDINADNWEEEVLKSEILVAVDFWHDHCPWCIMLDPIFNEVSNEFNEDENIVVLFPDGGEKYLSTELYRF